MRNVRRVDNVTDATGYAQKWNYVEYHYDGAGRVVATTSFVAYRGVQARFTPQYRYTQYDEAGKALKTRIVERGWFNDETGWNLNALVQVSTVDFHTDNVHTGYDAAGNLLGYVDATKTFVENVGSNDTRITTTVTNTNEHQNGQTRQAHVTTERKVEVWANGVYNCCALHSRHNLPKLSVAQFRQDQDRFPTLAS